MAVREIKPSGKVLRDPVHGLIRIDPKDAFILELIDTPEFQRLRRVRQLGVSWLTFHGAEHSRFSHSLGVFNFAQRMLDFLMRRYRGHADLCGYLEMHAREVKAAALLHDIGHAPFSHMLERAFEQTIRHEVQGIHLICDESGSIHRVLLDEGVDPQVVADIVAGTADALLCDIVSSQLDADRMDYLLRDSYFAGVEYGRYDAEWLLNAICVSRDPRQNWWRLCLDEDRGRHAAEQFLLARSHMSEQVYFHRVTRCFECMLLELFRRVRSLVVSGEIPNGTPGVVSSYLESKGQLSLGEWLTFDEPVFVSAIHAWAGNSDVRDPLVAEYARAFLLRQRLFVSRHVDDSELLQIGMKLPSDEKGQGWMIDQGAMTVYKGLAAGRGGKRDDVESLMVGSGAPDEAGRPMEEDSSLLKELERQRPHWTRVYYRRDMREKYDNLLGADGDGGR